VLQAREGRKGEEAEGRRGGGAVSAPKTTTRSEPGMMDRAGRILNSPMARTVGRELVRGLFGVLGLTAAARRRR
jgi:hypothetical protein